jgi:trehalose 6-phosphate phosphatase
MTIYWSQAWKRIEAQIHAAPHLLVACDFDGTIAPIVPRPEDATLADELRLLLRWLSLRGRLTLALVSGRSLEDLRRRVGLDGVYYCGNHGLEIEGPGFAWSNAHALDHRGALATAVAELRRNAEGIPGVIIEDKLLTATIHWRMVPDESRDALREMVAAAVESRPGLRLAHGKAIWEIRPRVDWDKGSAIRHLLQRQGLSTAEAVCLGDDDTDESAFRALPDGVTLRVGGSTVETAARYRLNDVPDASAFLFCLLNARIGARSSAFDKPEPIQTR